MERTFPGGVGSPAAARAFVSDAIGALVRGAISVQLCDDVQLVVSELVTNAVQAGSRSIVVSVGRADDRIQVTVRDEAEGWPEPRESGVRDPGGRGLVLVGAVSTAWGVRLAGGGKTVWAELAIPSAN